MPEPRVLTTAEERLLDLGNTLWNDKTPAGLAFREAARAKFPDAVTPESQIEPALAPALEAINAMRAEMAAEREAAAREREEQSQRDAERTLAQRVEDAAREFRLTDVGKELTLKRMQETGNFTDPHAAAAYIVTSNPPPRDITGLLGPQNKVNLFGQNQEATDDRMRKLLSDPMGGFLDAEFTDFLTDPDQYVRDAGIAA